MKSQRDKERGRPDRRRKEHKMTKEERTARIEAINKRLFELHMIDTWSNRTFEAVRELNEELRELEAEEKD